MTASLLVLYLMIYSRSHLTDNVRKLSFSYFDIRVRNHYVASSISPFTSRMCKLCCDHFCQPSRTKNWNDNNMDPSRRILSILPAVLFSVLAWARLYQLRLFPTTPEHGFITSKKTVLFAAIIWILASLGSLISWLATNSSDGTDGSGVASLALGVLCSVSLDFY